jgi:hypothetical protein
VRLLVLLKYYHYSLRNNPEERSSQILRAGSLKSHIVTTYFGFNRFPYDAQTGCCGQHKLATCVVFCYYMRRSTRGSDNSLARPTSRYILFDGENISFDASLVIYINSTNIPPIMIINRIYEHQNLLSP